MSIDFTLLKTKQVEEIIEKADPTKHLTVCRLFRPKSSYTLLAYVPLNFPDYDQLYSGRELYFYIHENKTYMSLKTPPSGIWYKRTVGSVGNTTRKNYPRLTIPTQIRKLLKIDDAEILHLIQDGDRYECVFL